MKTSSRRRALAGTIPVLLLSVAACSDDGADGAEASSPSTAALDASTTTAGGDTSTTEGDAGGGPSLAELEERLDLAMAELVAMPGGPPGVVGVVQIDDEKTTHAAGVADIDGDAAPTADDHMRVASVAKAFSGATALSLVDQGVLSLDDTIGERLPELPAEWADVTLRQLLNHTSGMPDFLRSPSFAEAARRRSTTRRCPRSCCCSPRTSH